MEKRIAVAIHFLLFSFAFVNLVNASDEFIADQFLGSPLLILVAVLIIDAIAIAYHRIRK